MANTIFLRSENDETDIELFVGFEAGAFRAESSAWFSLEKLNLFADGISAFPIHESAALELRGGICSGDGSEIVQGLVEISIIPFGNRGELSMQIRLAEFDDSNSRITRSASAQIAVSYREVGILRDKLLRVISSPYESASVQFVDFN